jgi:hypothetical protein
MSFNRQPEGITMHAQDILEHQAKIKELILANWIAAQALALEALAFQSE